MSQRWLEPELFQPFVFGIFACLSVSEFVRGALILSLLPTYGRSVLHFAVETTALALSLHYLVDNLLRAPSGWLVDHVGERAVLLTSFVISWASVLWMMQAHSVPALILSLCSFGIGANAVWPVTMAGIGHFTPPTKRATFMSYLYIFWLLGVGLGPVVINFLVGGTYRLAFIFLLVIDGIGFFTAYALVREPRRALEATTKTAAARTASAAATPATGAPATTAAPTPATAPAAGAAPENQAKRRRYRLGADDLVANFQTEIAVEPGLLRMDAQVGTHGRGTRRSADWHSLWQNIKEVAFLFPGMFAQTFAVASLIPILSVYASAVLHLSGAMYSMMLVAGGGLTVIGLIPTGKLVDRVGPRTPLVVAYLICGAALALFPLFRSLPATFAMVCTLGAAYSFVLPAWNAVLDRSIDDDKKGALWGVFMTVEGFGSAAGPYLGGLMWDHVSPSAPFWVSAGVIMLMGILYMVLPIERRYRTRPVQASWKNP